MHLEYKKKIKSRLSGEELEKLTQILNLKYAHISGERFFTIEDENSADVILMRVILKNTKESFYYPVEGRIKKVYIKIGNHRGINVLENSIFFKSYLAK